MSFSPRQEWHWSVACALLVALSSAPLAAQAPAPGRPAPCPPCHCPPCPGPVTSEEAPTSEGVRFHITLGVGMGGLGRGAVDATEPGASFDVRVGLGLLPWFDLEARYLGLLVDGTAPVVGEGVQVTTQGGSLVARFAPEVSWYWPYAFIGLGVYHLSPLGGGDVPEGGAALRGTTAMAIPLGLGIEVKLPFGLRVLLEGGYHPLLGESFSDEPRFASADVWTASLLAKWVL